MTKYVMGVDHGGTSTKAVLFDLQGHAVASAHQATPLLTPAPGHTERDMEALWGMNCRVIRSAIEESGVDPGDIIGVSFSGHGKGLYLWGKDQRPVRPGIVSTDSRAHAVVERWKAGGTARRAYARTFQSVLASQPVALLRWLMENEPQALEQTQYIFGVKDYIRYRMTGVARGEITDLSGSNLVNLQTADYDGELLKLFGLECVRDKLPPLAYPSELCGSVTQECAALTGLRAGTPVAAGLFDIDACAIGMNIVDDSRIAVIAGTWAINEYIARQPVAGESVKMNSLYCLPGYYLAEECSPTSASNYDWFLNLLCPEMEGKARYDWANAQVQAVGPEEQQMLFMPYLFGGCDDARAKAVLLGMEAWHSRAHLLRAVCEGIVYSHRKQVERLQRSRALPAQAVRLAGGVVRSPHWVQMFADIFKLPVETIDADELGALGAAMTAAVAAGAYEDLGRAAAAMVREGKVYLPDPQNAAIYDRKFQQYLRMERTVCDLFTEGEGR